MEKTEVASQYTDGLDQLMVRYAVLKEEPHVVEEFYPDLKIKDLERIALRGMWAYYKELSQLGLGIPAKARIREGLAYG